MPNNEMLSKAKIEKNDEFYTQYEDIQNEMNYYTKHFENKTVLCNCDDPFESNFCKFFLRNFNYLKLKRLICTSYSGSTVIATQLSLFDEEEQLINRRYGYVLDVNAVPMENGRGITDKDIERLLISKRLKKLKGNGDFRSQECIKYLDEADIVITNPPFSMFREYIALLIEKNKQFIIIGNMNALHYKEIFPYIRDNLVWLGASIHSGDRKFYVPDTYPLNASGCGIDESGRKYIRVKGVRWYTNIDYIKRHDELILYKKYDSVEYPKYANFDAIDVKKVSDIPVDYFGFMGVPDNFIDSYNPDQFEIIGLGSGDLAKMIGVKKNYRGRTDLAYKDINGKDKCPYSRIIIRRKTYEN